MRVLRPWSLSGVLLLSACGSASPAVVAPIASRAESESAPLVVSIVGTNDLHGHVEALPAFSGYVRALEARRATDGVLVLLDGGDMFQGTLESNLVEGAPVVAAYAALGYDAVTIGNHEFDYGPVGELATPGSASDDRRGALRARIDEAPFPFLASNLLDRRTHALAELGTASHPVLPSVVLERAGLRIGVIGITTEQTLTTTAPANVDDLEMRPLVDAIAEHAATLRSGGADLVLVAAHAGGECTRFDDPEDASSCEADEEIMRVAEALAPGTVDAIVAGHTHQAMAHVVHGTPIVESYSYGRAFGRVDFTIDRASHRVLERHVHPPTEICHGEACGSASYEGQAIVATEDVQRIVDAAVGRASDLRRTPVGVTLTAPITLDGRTECALGNLFTDLMRAARPQADVAVYNGGGLRADLPAGPLEYGAFYQALPFDNRFALVRMTGADLAAMIAHNAGRDGSFLSISGVTATVRCEGRAGHRALRVTLVRPNGRPIREDEAITVVASDFLASGGDGTLAAVREREGAVTIESGAPMRDAMVEALRRRGGELAPADVLDGARPRVVLPTPRPVRCE